MGRTRKSADRRNAAQMHALAAVRRDIRSHGSSGPRKYLREFTNAFRGYQRVLSGPEFHSHIDRADVFLLGDYHSLPASQRFAATLVEQIAHSRPVVLAVEAVLARDQGILDQWWRREISEAQLRERLRFDREWGYDWPPFYELLVAARDHGEALYGIDCLPRHDMRRIRSRDRHAAERIRAIRQRHPDAALVVLFGESHLAPGHLPKELAAALPEAKPLTILQNLDPIYWQAVAEDAAAVSLRDDAICVFNSTPLEKYESYRLCLERWHTNDAADFTPVVHNLILALARTLGFRADSPHNGTQPRNLRGSLPEVAHFAEQDDLRLLLPADARESIEQRGCVYMHRTNTIYIREFRAAGAAAECARFLHHACKGMPVNAASDENEDILSDFGARLLCPGDGPRHPKGEALYRDYLEGRITRAAVRKLFLARA
jgi:hypothetical protein